MAVPLTAEASNPSAEGEPDFTRIRPVRVRMRMPASAHDVFAYVSDPRNDPHWVDTTPKVTQIAGEGPIIGAAYEYEQTVGRPVVGHIHITDMAAPSYMAFRVEDPLRIYRVEYRITPKGDGCVLEQASYPWLKSPKLRKKTWLLRLLTPKQLRKQMRALKAQLSTVE